MRKIISIKDIIDCNAFLKERNLPYRIHLRDACGKQSCWIESLDSNLDELWDTKIKSLLEQFFADHGFQLEFSEDGKDFWLKLTDRIKINPISGICG